MSRSGALLSAGSGSGAIGATTFVKPSADATGVTDVAAINAALVAGSVTLNGDYTINAPIQVPSSRTLILADAKVRLANGSNCNVIRNTNQDATGNTDIYIRGIGRAIFDGNAVNQSRLATPNFYKNIGALWVNVTRLVVEDVTLGPMNAFACCMQACVDVRISRINLAQDVSTANQDGFDIWGGSNITIDGVRGRTGDDLFGIFAFSTPGVGVITPYYATLTNAQRSVDGVYLRNADVDIGINAVRFIAGDGSTIKNVTVDQVRQRNANYPSGGAALCFGPPTYTTTYAAPGDVDKITASRFSGPFENLIDLSSHAQGVTLRDVHLTKWSRILKRRTAQAGMNPDVRRISISEVHSPTVTPGEFGTVCELDNTFATVYGLQLHNFSLGRATSILNNACNLTAVDIDGIHVEIMNGNPFVSTGVESGTIDNFSWSTIGGKTGTWMGAPTGLRFGSKMPPLSGGDVVPKPVLGSVLVTDTTINPTGGATGHAYEFIGNGISWIQAADLGAVLGVAPILLDYDAASLALADAAAVAAWANGGSTVGANVAQGTAAKQPTFVARHVDFAGKPAVSFDGSNDSLVSAALGATISQPVTVVAIYKWRSLPAGSLELFDGSISSSARPTLYRPSGTTSMALYAGTANLLSSNAAVSGLARIATGVFNGASSVLRLNGIETSGTNPGAGGISAVSLGALWNDTSFGPVDIARLIVYGAALSAADRANVETALAASYGVAVP